uniref:Uncharacterized protein n=1 Tax=Mesocestoides corti TaxID=53468 RepID=A0A5K3FZZ0_MESCO
MRASQSQQQLRCLPTAYWQDGRNAAVMRAHECVMNVRVCVSVSDTGTSVLSAPQRVRVSNVCAFSSSSSSSSPPPPPPPPPPSSSLPPPPPPPYWVTRTHAHAHEILTNAA